MPNLNRASSGDVVDLENYVGVTLSVTTTAAQTAVLPEGYYAVWTSADCAIRVGPTATGVTAINGYLLRTGVTLVVYVRNGSRIGAIVAASTATLTYHQVG